MATTVEATTGTPLLDRLAGLERAVEAAAAGVRERELELARERRAVDRAEAELAGHVEAVAAGEREPDDGELGRLEAALAAAEADVAVRHSDHWRTGPRVEVRHPRAEAALAGARRALERAKAERGGFAASEWRGLLAELRPADREAAAGHEEAAAGLEAARAAVVARRRLHVRLAGYAGREPATDHLPDTGAAR